MPAASIRRAAAMASGIVSPAMKRRANPSPCRIPYAEASRFKVLLPARAWKNALETPWIISACAADVWGS
jgi:hypothetical protein